MKHLQLTIKALKDASQVISLLLVFAVTIYLVFDNQPSVLFYEGS